MSHHRRLVVSIVLLFVVLLGAFGVMSQTAAQDEDFHYCDFAFEATVHDGPSAGLALVGDLQLFIDPTGSAIGSLYLEDGSQVATYGQVNGRAVNLIFDLGAAKYIYGVGTAFFEVVSDDCGGILGGPFVGPESGDSGDWDGSSIRCGLPGNPPCGDPPTVRCGLPGGPPCSPPTQGPTVRCGLPGSPPCYGDFGE